jgi:hypothetical protein
MAAFAHSYGEEFTERCRGVAERLEQYGVQSPQGGQVIVPADLLLEAASFVRGYEQSLMFYHHLGITPERECVCDHPDELVQEWVAKARAVARQKAQEDAEETAADDEYFRSGTRYPGQ